MEKINIAELLKDCPEGMELDCTIYDNVTLEYVTKSSSLPICVRIQNKGTMFLSRYGQVFEDNNCKCVIYPKGKTTWEGFVPPCQFKDGDVVSVENACGCHTFIYNNITDEYVSYGYYVIITSRDNFKVNGFCAGDEYRIASEEEKAKLFKAIKDNGYKWNAETKTLEKLVVPKFKAGDKVKDKNNRVWFVVQVFEKHFDISSVPNAEGYCVPIDDQDDYELVPDKFDITALKPFDKVLARDIDNSIWTATLFSHLRGMKFYTAGGWYNQCIPFDGNEHLLGKTDVCDEYYKTWE